MYNTAVFVGMFRGERVLVRSYPGGEVFPDGKCKSARPAHSAAEMFHHIVADASRPW